MELSRSGFTLSDRYTATDGWVYMTGVQALVRLPLQQRLRDAALGWNTGGYVSGYRGSPLGRYDTELWAAQEALTAAGVVFRAGLNEDLAATAIWGAQHVGNFPGARVDGVFGIWYGKGPGVDRSGDVLRHGNLAGASSRGGVLCMAGDDHGAKSSTVANFSDPIFIAVGMPVLYPSSTQELLDFGLHGIAMSRHSGCWVGMKVVTDVVEGGGSVRVSPDLPHIVVPPAAGPELSIRVADPALAQEQRLYHHKLPAALAYARANGLNRITLGNGRASVGIVAAGKAWQDVLQAMGELGIDDDRAEALGLRLLKIGMVWPLDPQIVRQFAAELQTILVVEEKRPILEDQLRAILFETADRPTVIGKHRGAAGFDAQPGPVVFPNAGEISPAQVAHVLCSLLGLQGRGAFAPPAPAPASGAPTPVRMPGFCSGCPHNRSTKVPHGSRALAGIGCHAMATLIDPAHTNSISHMGGEGVMWLGQQPFTQERHVFANLGDGTFSHSGHLAVRQAVAAHVPITYKLLYNGFVSMTGGQPVESGMSPVAMLRVLDAEGVRKMAVVTDDPGRYEGLSLPEGVQVHHRSRLELVEREFRDFPDVSVIVYDQPCATERRRMRKRGKWPDPDRRTFIHAAVCEGCGDCGTASNCMSIEPLETELGRKRRINQSSCNKDFSCVDGFCPSFVTIEGGTPKRGAPLAPANAQADPWSVPLPEPTLPALGGAFSVLVAGIGGTGVVTIGQTLAVAAHLDGRFASNLDVTGLAQKYGAVASHVRIAASPEQLHATRIASGELDALIGCDLLVSAGTEAVAMLRPGRSRAVVCADVIPTSDFARNPQWSVDIPALKVRIEQALGGPLRLIEGQRLATVLLGDPIASNMMMLGAAWQLGMVPVSRAALERAIELNAVAVALNKSAFLWGRRAAQDLDAVERIASAGRTEVIRFVPSTQRSLDQLVEHRSRHLQEHGTPRAVLRLQNLVARVRQAETEAGLGDALARVVADNHHRLLAVKDEWEVARLYSHPDFRATLEREFDGPLKLRFHVGGWPFGRIDAATGKPIKKEVGPWLLQVFRLMGRLRFLRGTWLDPFRNTTERRLDQEWLSQYESDIERLIGQLDASRHALAVKIAKLPDSIRGYGHVRMARAAAAGIERARLLAEWEALAR